MIIKKVNDLLKSKGKVNIYQQLVEKSDYFDKKWYKDTYHVDDPVQDYLNEGWCLGRDPSMYFSTNEYLELNPDVKKANINPLLHYELNGKKEFRLFKASKQALITTK